MVRVTVEILPGGHEKYAAVVAVAGIANTSPAPGPSDYVGVLRTFGHERVVFVKRHVSSHGV